MVIKVCVGSACYVKGSHKVINEIKSLIETNNLTKTIELKAAFCLGHCTNAVSVSIDDLVMSVDCDNVSEFFNENVLKKVKECK